MTRSIVSLSFGLVMLALPAQTHAVPPADTIYHGGPILTMHDEAMRAEAVAVADSRIIAVGTLEEVTAYQGDTTQIFDLQGQTLLPGFVDSHGHVVFGGIQALSANLLPPPDGPGKDIASLMQILREWHAANADTAEAVNLILGFGYDQAQLAELRHPTREELDAVSTEMPVLIIHQSGHFGVANSLLLAAIGYDADTPDPAGGIIRRQPDGMPNGVLEETAFFNALGTALAGIDASGMQAIIQAGAGLWASYGYTTGQEGRTDPNTVAGLQAAGKNGLLPIDVAVYPDVLIDREFIAANQSDTYQNRVRVAGAKLTIDGSPQGFTALRDRPYYDPVGDYEQGWAGYAAASRADVFDAVSWAYENDLQIITHANGEGASDMLIAALQTAESTHGGGDRRPVLIHGQFLREDQIDHYQDLGTVLSLFPMHTFYWGDWHRDHTVGPVNAENISPTGWVRQRGMMFGTHHDAPVALPNSMRVLDATVTRRTRSGDILGPTHRVDVITALKAMTIWPAYQHFEEHEKGSIAAGKRADFVVLSADPTAVDPESLDSLRVLVTIKDNEIVYDARNPNAIAGFVSDFPAGANLAPGHCFLHMADRLGLRRESAFAAGYRAVR